MTIFNPETDRIASTSSLAIASAPGAPRPTGFRSTIKAPASMARNDRAISAGSWALTMMIGFGVLSMIRVVAW